MDDRVYDVLKELRIVQVDLKRYEAMIRVISAAAHAVDSSENFRERALKKLEEDLDLLAET